MTDPIITNTQNAESSPATGPTIDSVEKERLSITSHPQWFAGGPEKAALLERMRKLTGDVHVNEAPAPSRQQAITAKLIDPTTSAADKQALQQELAALVAHEDVEALEQEPLEMLRDRFGIKPDVPPVLADVFDEEGEAVALRSFAFHGVQPAAARELRDWYMRSVFIPALGDPANVEDPAALVAEFRKLAAKHGLPQALTDAMIEEYGGEGV